MKLTNLRELSLRNNPLVLRFVKEWPNTVPTLLELSGRCVKKNSIPYTRELIPGVLVEYLDRAQHCDNPQCNGVYFTSRVQSVKFVDFCGKYRVPLMQYLCSAMCVSDDSNFSSSSEDEADEAAKHRMKKVLLGWVILSNVNFDCGVTSFGLSLSGIWWSVMYHSYSHHIIFMNDNHNPVTFTHTGEYIWSLWWSY